MFNSASVTPSSQPLKTVGNDTEATGPGPRAPEGSSASVGDQKRAPSNSPLSDKTFYLLDLLNPSDQYRPYCLKIDRLTILADTTMHKDRDGELTSREWIRWTNHPDVISRHFAKWPYLYQFKTASGYVVQFAGHKSNCPEIRIDLNPASLRGKSDSLRLLFACLRHPRLSRLDLCIDYPFDLSDWMMTHSPSVKEQVFYGTGKRVETHYFGSARSNLQIRVYDKSKEAKIPGPLWRVEAQYRFTPTTPLHSIRPFSGLRIWQPGHGLSFPERAALYYLADHPSAWSEVSKPTRLKLLRLSKLDLSLELDPQPSAIFDREFPRLLDRLKPLLSVIPFGDDLCTYNMEDFTDAAV